MEPATRAAILDDVLQHGLKVIFSGTGVGPRSSRQGQYYAGVGNVFWGTLANVGFTPRSLQPTDWRDLPKYGIGLTDLVKLAAGTDAKIPRYLHARRSL